VPCIEQPVKRRATPHDVPIEARPDSGEHTPQILEPNGSEPSGLDDRDE